VAQRAHLTAKSQQVRVREFAVLAVHMGFEVRERRVLAERGISFKERGLAQPVAGTGFGDDHARAGQRGGLLDAAHLREAVAERKGMLRRFCAHP
jgi:hypothetical protein